MIIKKLVNTHQLLCRCLKYNARRSWFSSGKMDEYNGNVIGKDTQVSTNLRTDLVQKLESMNIRTEKSIFIQQQPDDSTQIGENNLENKPKPKKNKYQFRTLTTLQKQQLGLMIPQSPFKLRMTKQCEFKYRSVICQNLYQAQKQNLQTQVRILQLQGSNNVNIDQYINSTYKDIFARYMLARGLGFEWEGNSSNYGVVNPAEKAKQQANLQIKEFYKWVCELIQQYPISKKQILGLYSYARKKFIKISDVQVQNIYKIGYYYTMQVTGYGRFQQNFQVIKERGQKIQLLVMVQDISKLLNIQAICVEPNKKMIILSKYKQQYISEIGTSEMQVDQSKINSYLITSMDVYVAHKQYFNSNGYTKHLLFDSEYMLEMKVGNNIPVFKEIQGFSRTAGAYVVDRYSGLPDFQRIDSYQLNQKNSYKYLDQQGRIVLPTQQNKSQNTEQIYITDPKYQQKLLKKLQTKQHTLQAKRFDLNFTYQDQIYSYDEQKLHFVISNKYVIPIPQSHYSDLSQAIQKSIVSESKVKVPSINRFYPKPRDKRRHIKQIRKLRQQQTQYMGLRESLQAIEELPFSVVYEDDKNMLQFPVFVCQSIVNGVVEKEQVYVNSKIKQVISDCLNISSNDKNRQKLVVQWDMKKLNQFLSTLNQQANINSKDNQTNIKFYIRFVKLTENLLNGYKCFKNYTKNPQLSNIVIEPQSKTQDIVPYFFHLHYMLHKKMLKQSKQPHKQRGRRMRNVRMQKKFTDKLFSLIKFHPTIVQSQKNKNVDEILFGVVKLNKQQQYGYGLQALRLWVARNDNYLGDRKLSDKFINKQLQIAAFIRKLYWQLLPLTNINLDKIIISNEQNQIQIVGGSNQTIPRQKLTYFHNFILDHINYYILNMQQCYTKLDLSKALDITQDFFKNYIQEIFVKTVRKRIISYPLSQQTKQHIYVIKRILDLLAVVAPLLPYSSYHISKSQMLTWPEIKLEDVRPELIPSYNRMTKLRVQVRNKFMINSFYHSQIVIPLRKIVEQQQQKQQNQNLTLSKNGQKVKSYYDFWNLSKQDLQLFFDLQNVSFDQPKELSKSFKLKIKQNHPIGQIGQLKFHQYKDICIRCSPNRNYGTHLCSKCLDYLNNNFGKSLPLNK